jgi:hypothetical protein
MTTLPSPLFGGEGVAKNLAKKNKILRDCNAEFAAVGNSAVFLGLHKQVADPAKDVSSALQAWKISLF